MVDFTYLYKGICGLAHAHQASALAGHLGAAVAAGYFFGEDNQDLNERVFAGVQKELDRILQGEEAFWYNAKQAGISVRELFEPFPKQPGDEKRIPKIAEALAVNIGQTRQSGHNVIFASIAIRALLDHPEYATPQIVEGICRLIRQFDKAHAGRGYYGKQQGWKTGNQVQVKQDDDFPLYKNEQELATVTLDELLKSAAVRRRGFGGLWHLINHAAALVELSCLGYSKLARQGFPAHRHHLRLWRTLPDVEQELGAVVPSEVDPRQPKYWDGDLKRDDARLTHRIKTLYGFFALARIVEDRDRVKRAEKSLLYLMA